MPKYNFNKVAKRFYSSHTSAWVFSYKFAAYFSTPFLKITSGGLLLKDAGKGLKDISGTGLLTVRQIFQESTRDAVLISKIWSPCVYIC